LTLSEVFFEAAVNNRKKAQPLLSLSAREGVLLPEEAPQEKLPSPPSRLQAVAQAG